MVATDGEGDAADTRPQPRETMVEPRDDTSPCSVLRVFDTEAAAGCRRCESCSAHAFLTVPGASWCRVVVPYADAARVEIDREFAADYPPVDARRPDSRSRHGTA